jgi:hypothetical protein
MRPSWLGSNNMTKAQQTIIERVHNDFAQRPCPAGDDPDRHADRELVRSILGDAAKDLLVICPQSRELNHAINKLEEALGWAGLAIDRHAVSSPETRENVRLHDDIAIPIKWPMT